jgi:uncharacterized protein with FMN-binding domain
MHNRRQPQKTLNPGRIFRKLFLSAFVVSSFVLYAINKPVNSSDSAVNLVNPPAVVQDLRQPMPTPTAPPPDGTSPLLQQDPGQAAPPTDVPTAVPQQVFIPTPVPPTATSVPSKGLFKDGTYKGVEVDAFYGLVQVQTIIQNGKIKNVQFLEYPNDRRTSVRINSIAVPDLQQEALQAQSAAVDIISGATLTSEAFIMSLQSALANAKS